jgi:hypothetical protein
MFNRKQMLTERGHDQPTVKRPKEDQPFFSLLKTGRFSEPPRFALQSAHQNPRSMQFPMNSRDLFGPVVRQS